MSFFKSSLGCTAVAVLLAGHALSASGATLDKEAPRRVVHYSDLNIGNADGAATLYSRITIAAREVCEPELSSWQVAFTRDTYRCRQQSVERAVSEVNAPALTSYFRTKRQPAGDRQ